MATYGIELSNAGFQAAVAGAGEPRLVETAGAAAWPGFAYHDGQKLSFGRAAEDVWFVHPRQVCHVFWDKLSHESSSLSVAGKAQSFSELAYYFLRDYAAQLAKSAGTADRVVLAVPDAFLRDAAAEEQMIGLLLGMAGELRLPLVGILDLASAALCDPTGPGVNPALPVVHVDLHLSGADLSLHMAEGGRLVRRETVHLMTIGQAALLKHLTAAMGNRFLKQTAFDILEDGRIEQSFYRQTKDFMLGGAAEFRYQINTARRTYEMTGTQEQLVVDAAASAATLVQGVQALVQKLPERTGPVTIALSDRAAAVPGLESRLRASGLTRLIRLPAGAAARGAAFLGTQRAPIDDLADVPVETGVALAHVRQAIGMPWEAHLHKVRLAEPRPLPTHVIIDGLGHVIGGNGKFTIGSAGASPDLRLPEPFNAAGDCLVKIVREDGRLWFADSAGASEDRQTRTALEAGDRIVVRCGPASADLLFAHCREGGRGPS
ncbi:MAG TPA: hypothetical protein VG936_08975 [Lacunisphaera sp.]|nr:hypothetical protein [Lacunisphaera sp.]